MACHETPMLMRLTVTSGTIEPRVTRRTNRRNRRQKLVIDVCD